MHKNSDEDELLELENETFKVLSAAQLYAQRGDAKKIDDAHLLLGALAVDGDETAMLRELLVRSGLKWNEVWLYATATAGLKAEPPTSRHEPASIGAGQLLTLELTERAVDVMNKATTEAGKFAISPVHVFIACFSAPGDSQLTQTFAPLGIEPMRLRLHCKQLLRAQSKSEQLSPHPLEMLAPDGKRAIEAAHAAMRASFCGRISTLHLLIGVLENPNSDAVAALAQRGLNVEELRTKSRSAIVSDGEIAGPEPKFTPAAKRALDRAKDALYQTGNGQIGTLEIWQGLQPHRIFWLEIFQFGWNPADPAAEILAALDTTITRPIIEKLAQTEPNYSLRPFQLFFGGQIFLGVLLRLIQGIGWLWMHEIATVIVQTVGIVALIGVSIFALYGMASEQGEAFEKTWFLAFIGAILGFIFLFLLALS